MCPRKYEVNDEMASRWVERHRRGDSFRKIGLDEGVERRVVARVVKDFKAEQYVNERAATLRDVRAEFIREHLKTLQIAGGFLLELTVAPSIVRNYCSYPSDIALKLHQMIEDKMPSQRPPFLSAAPLNPNQYTHAREKEAKIIVSDLQEHLPEQWEQVEQWQNMSRRYTENLEQLKKQAEDKGIELPLFEAGLRECLDSMAKFLREDNLPPIPKNLESAADVALWLFKNATTRELLKPFHDNLQALENEYAKLEDMLNPFELRKALLERECRHCPLPQG